jgi:hypothetical protein
MMHAVFVIASDIIVFAHCSMTHIAMRNQNIGELGAEVPSVTAGGSLLQHEFS